MIRRIGLAAFLICMPALCDTINLGFLSYDVLIPGGPGPGIDVFTISNLTGDPGTGGFALPPDFPALTFLTLSNSSLTVVIGGIPQMISLGDIAPGSFSPVSLQFPDSTMITSATFTATLSPSTLLLSDGTTFVANAAIDILLVPASGSTLVAGSDLALLSATNSTATPEPATLWPLIVGLGILATRPRRVLITFVERS